METYISLLRGINVHGSRMIKMDQLKKLYSGLHLTRVQNYIQSGNLFFDSEETDSLKLEMLISEAIKVQLGFEVPILVLRRESLLEILENNPFLKEDPNVMLTHLYVTLLKDFPSKSITDNLQTGDDLSSEKYFIRKQSVYLYLPGGYGRARLNNSFFENRLKTPATTRNWKTLTALATLTG